MLSFLEDKETQKKKNNRGEQSFSETIIKIIKINSFTKVSQGTFKLHHSYNHVYPVPYGRNMYRNTKASHCTHPSAGFPCALAVFYATVVIVAGKAKVEYKALRGTKRRSKAKTK